MRERTALITGASSGIGYEIAALLVRRGYTVIMSSRDAERLEEAAMRLRAGATAPLHTVAQDMAAPDAATHLQAWCVERQLLPDILINNAGLGHFGAFAASDWDAQRAMIDLNVRGLTHLSHAFLPAMKAQRRGEILHVGSVAGFCPGPLMAVYYASKAYVTSFSVALRNEVGGQGIKVACLCPGPVKTRFQEQAGLSASKLAQASYMEADVVAREGLKGLARNQAIIIPGRRSKMFAFFAHYTPPTLAARLVRGVQDTK